MEPNSTCLGAMRYAQVSHKPTYPNSRIKNMRGRTARIQPNKRWDETKHIPAVRSLAPLLTLVLGWVLAADAAIAAAPHDVSSFGDLTLIHARDHLNTGKPELALREFEAYLARKTTSLSAVHHETRFLAARAALLIHKPTRAIELLADLDNAMPEVSDVITFYRAKAQRQAGLWKLAQKTWLSITTDRNSPWRGSALYDLADTHYALGDLRGATRAYAEAVQKEGRDARIVVALYNLGRIAEMEGDFAQARTHYESLRGRFPSHPLHQPASARLRVLNGLAGVQPVPKDDGLRKIDTLLKARSLEEADIAINDLLKANAHAQPSMSSQRDLSYRQGQLYYRQHRFDQAIATFSTLMNSERNSRRKRDFERWLARTYSAAGRTNDAVQVHLNIYERAEGLRSERDALYRAAWLAYNGGAFKRAVQLFEQYVQAYPNERGSADALWYFGWSSFRSGDLPQARRIFSSLRRRYANTALAHRSLYWLARIERLIGRQDKARALYQETIAERPLTYYAVLAQQRLSNMGRTGVLVASIEPMPAALLIDQTPKEHMMPSLMQTHGHAATTALHTTAMPWGAPVFDWKKPQARRALRLMRLGMMDIAADEIARLKPVRGSTKDDVDYARARLLFALGDYHRAYRIAGRTFRTRLKNPVSEGTRRLAHLAYPVAHTALTTEVAQEVGISPLLIWSLMRQESAYDDRARSWASANGLMQIIPRTGRKIANRLHVTDTYNFAVLQDPKVNVKFGAWYLDELLTKFHGHVALAIGSYNAGPVAMARWLTQRPSTPTDQFVEDIPYTETRRYVKRVIGNLAVYEALYGKRALVLPETVPSSSRDNINF